MRVPIPAAKMTAAAAFTSHPLLLVVVRSVSIIPDRQGEENRSPALIRPSRRPAAPERACKKGIPTYLVGMPSESRWLGRQDSNLDNEIQNLGSYR